MPNSVDPDQLEEAYPGPAGPGLKDNDNKKGKYILQ